MSEKRRRYPQNSVVASIDQIQAMLAEERRPAAPAHPAVAARTTAPPDAPPPPDEAEQARPLAMPVGGANDLAVASWEEVQNNRAARWANETQAVMVPAIPRRRIWKRRMLLGGVALLLIGATVGVMWVLRPQVPLAQPFEVPYLKAQHAAETAARAAAAQQQIAALQAQLDAMTTERDALNAQLKSAQDQAAQAAAVADTVAAVKPAASPKPKRRVRKRSTRTRRKVRRRTPRRATKTDKSLEGLLNTL